MKRLDLPGVAQHVAQRGNNRQACFFHEVDYIRYLQELLEASMRHGCQVHAYVLMTNHVHLLVTPGSTGGVSKMLQAVGRRYVRYVNDSSARTGTLWEGRFKASLVDSECDVLACYRHIELNPVRACMTAAPGDYRWSSYAANACGTHDALVTPHPAYRALALDPSQCPVRYREFVAQAIPEEEMAAIRPHVQRQRAVGSGRFQSQAEQLLQRRARIKTPDRPKATLVL